MKSKNAKLEAKKPEPSESRARYNEENYMMILSRLIMIGTVVGIVCVASARSFARERTGLAMAQLVGACFLLVVIFAHVSEAFKLIPSLGWGRPGTVGHYIDLASAFAGSILLTLGYFARWMFRRRIQTEVGNSITEV